MSDIVSVPIVLGASALWAAQKVVGPGLEEIGEIGRDWAKFRRRNVSGVMEAAAAKVSDDADEDEFVPARVAVSVVEAASWADDDFSREYLAGVLAASRSKIGDDRGLAYSSLLASLPTVQLKTHYLVYASIRRLYMGEHDRMGSRIHEAEVFIRGEEYSDFMGVDQVTGMDIATHAAIGLEREGLTDHWYVGPLGPGRRYPLPPAIEPPELWGMIIAPTFAGAELFMLAHGVRTASVRRVVQQAAVFEPVQDLPIPIDGVTRPAGR